MSGNAVLLTDDLYPIFDDRTKGWEMLKLWFLMGMVVFYLIVCKFLKQYMNNRQAFDVKQWMILYNICITALSAYMFHEFFFATFWKQEFNWFCQPVRSNKVIDDRLLSVCWWYYMSKFIEFFDTWFMLLRKKYSQVSFLHLYHHTSIALITWYATVFVPGGSTFFAPLLNCFVHTVMYFYYLLAAVGVNQKYLWWKKYITKLQLTQFVLILAHSILGMIIGCGFPRHYLLVLFFYNVSMFWLFSDFYTKCYTSKSQVASSKGEVAVNEAASAYSVPQKHIYKAPPVHSVLSEKNAATMRSSPRLRRTSVDNYGSK